MAMPMGSGVPTGLGEGPIRIVGPISQPRGYHRSRITHTDIPIPVDFYFAESFPARVFKVLPNNNKICLVDCASQRTHIFGGFIILHVTDLIIGPTI